MLRESSATKAMPLDLGAIRDSTRDPLTPFGPELLAFTDALVMRDPDELAIAREALAMQLGDAAVVPAANVVATFEMMNRLLDGVGAPPNPKFMNKDVSIGLNR